MSGLRAGLAERSAGGISVAIEPGGRSETPGDQTQCRLEGTLFNLDRLSDLLATGKLAPERLLAVAYERWGEEMIGRLRGNFALLVHDRRRQRILLACDQLGGKSLFFHCDGSRLRFAAELVDLIARLPTRPPPDDAAVVRWLADTCTPEGRTLYKGVNRVGAGQLLTFDRHGLDVRRYWAPSFQGCADYSPEEATEATREAIAGAVRRQVPDGEPSGVLLSGGLDSSSVAALASRQSAASPPRAYSAVFPEHPSIDESSLIDEAAASLGLDGSRVEVRGGSMVRGALEYMQRWEVPLPAPNHFLWQPLLERAASDGTELILDGEGGDELWRFSPYLLADRLRSGRLVSATRLGREMLGGQYKGRSSLQPYLRLYGIKGAIPPGAHARLRSLHQAQRYAPAWFTERSADTLLADWDPWAWKRLDGPRWWSFMADLLTGVRERLGVGDYLRRRAAMAGLQDRHPLIDVDLVEFALRLPPTLAIDPVLERPMLRRATEGLIPDSIRLRPQKSYFTALFQDCLEGRDLELIRKLFAGRPEVAAYVSLESVQRHLLAAPPAGQRRDRSWPWSIWRLLTAECWLRSQRDGDFAGEMLEACEARSGDLALL
jgi:asparagine synthase (glutamine-hydrolysing)